jgi:hypothetical protein
MRGADAPEPYDRFVLTLQSMTALVAAPAAVGMPELR